MMAITTSSSISVNAAAIRSRGALSPSGFPLTPSLSLGEREKRAPILEKSKHCGRQKDRPTILSLLLGEGWGEGEGIKQEFVISKFSLVDKLLDIDKFIKPRQRLTKIRERQFDSVGFSIALVSCLLLLEKGQCIR